MGWFEDYREKNPEMRIADKFYFRDAILFKLPDNIIGEKDSVKMVDRLKEIIIDNDENTKIRYDLSVPPYDNVVYFFKDAGRTYAYWVVNMGEVKSPMGEDSNYFVFVPLHIVNNYIESWVRCETDKDLDIYSIHFIQNKKDFSVDLSLATVKHFSGEPLSGIRSKTLGRHFLFIYTLLKINALLNCINILKIKNEHPKKLQKARIKRGKLPLQSYYTLKIKGVTKKYEDTVGTKDPQWNNRIHLCRGHFKRYTEEKPLLGKYVGLWWWQPIVRGINKKGVIFKDYELQ